MKKTSWILGATLLAAASLMATSAATAAPLSAAGKAVSDEALVTSDASDFIVKTQGRRVGGGRVVGGGRIGGGRIGGGRVGGGRFVGGGRGFRGPTVPQRLLRRLGGPVAAEERLSGAIVRWQDGRSATRLE